MDNFDNIAQYPMYFAPGCRLLQLQPQMVSEVYDYLRQLFGSNMHLYTAAVSSTTPISTTMKPSSSPYAIPVSKSMAKPMQTCICATSGTSMTNTKTSIPRCQRSRTPPDLKEHLLWLAPAETRQRLARRMEEMELEQYRKRLIRL